MACQGRMLDWNTHPKRLKIDLQIETSNMKYMALWFKIKLLHTQLVYTPWSSTSCPSFHLWQLAWDVAPVAITDSAELQTFPTAILDIGLPDSTATGPLCVVFKESIHSHKIIKSFQVCHWKGCLAAKAVDEEEGVRLTNCMFEWIFCHSYC